jgi:hypothetical protein
MAHVDRGPILADLVTADDEASESGSVLIGNGQ